MQDGNQQDPKKKQEETQETRLSVPKMKGYCKYQTQKLSWVPKAPACLRSWKLRLAHRLPENEMECRGFERKDPAPDP
ncbi:glycosyltransferase [Clarias magur]|uniref:Glycosyltransferase n=1 Tax=Clarias magur TaxID=1594786 RepID=A0A8J4UJY3_CLAMG|nr:glycosyltransferase [Clarias magur]